MYKFLTKNGQLAAFGGGVLITVITLAIIFSGLEGFNALTKETRGTTGIFDFGLYAVIGLTILCVIAMVVFGVMQIVSDPKGSSKGLMGFGVLIVFAIIAYAMSSGEATGKLAFLLEKFEVSAGASKFISACITTALGLTVVAALAFVLSELRNFFK